jgi:hypothetical protein
MPSSKQYTDGHRTTDEVLLKAKVLIHSHYSLKSVCFRLFQEFPVRQSFPSHFFRRVYFVIGELVFERLRYAMIEKNLHLAGNPSMNRS